VPDLRDMQACGEGNFDEVESFGDEGKERPIRIGR